MDDRLYGVLRTIQDSDPDGRPEQPTAADHRAHQEWAIETFGTQAWVAYRRAGCGDPDGPGARLD